MASRFLKGYYVCNVLLISSYAALRVLQLDPGELGARDILGFTRESSVYVSVALLLFTRLLSASTVDAYLATAFKVCAVGISLLLWFMDDRLLRVFGSLYIAVHMLFPQPRFSFSQSIGTLNAVELERRVLGSTHKSFHVVWTHATWAPRCTQLAPVISAVARRGAHARVRFSKLDVGRAAAAAARLGVSLAPTSQQLPCAILFRRGKEVARVPGCADKDEIDARWRDGFSANEVWEEFGMDAVLCEAREWEETAKQKLNAPQLEGDEDKKAQ